MICRLDKNNFYYLYIINKFDNNERKKWGSRVADGVCGASDVAWDAIVRGGESRTNPDFKSDV